MSEIIGFSGSPIPNSNLDYVIKRILSASDLPSEFIKLSRLHIRPCTGCLKCVPHNKCVQNDDMPELLQKIEAARGIVIGGFPTFFSLNASTKTFLERWFPLKHRMLTAGKFGIAVAIGFRDTSIVEDYLASFFGWFRMPLIGTLSVPGNAPCLSCGRGEQCEYSNVPLYYGSKEIDKAMFRDASQNVNLMKNAEQLGKALAEKLRGEDKYPDK